MSGAIEDFDIVRFGGPTVPDEFDVLIGVTATEIIKDDPDRLAVTITNNDGGPVYVSSKPLTSSLNGSAIGSGIALVYQVQNDGTWCGRRLYGIAPAGPFTVHVTTLRRQSRAR
jgi:hypothetical protein